jgi:hypothetical protein
VEHLKARRGPQALVEDLEIVSILFVLFFYGLVWEVLSKGNLLTVILAGS